MKERTVDEQRTREEELMRRTNEDMQLKMTRQEEIDYYLDLLNEYKCYDPARGDSTEDS